MWRGKPSGFVSAEERSKKRNPRSLNSGYRREMTAVTPEVDDRYHLGAADDSGLETAAPRTLDRLEARLGRAARAWR
jgi:hypothetical protein